MQLRRRDGLLEVITGPLLQSRRGGVDPRMPGENNNLEVGIDILQRRHRPQSIHPGHKQVGDDHLERTAAE